MKFYIAEVVSVLNDLHQMGYVHRDLKPDNMLIAHNGHTELVDFAIYTCLTFQTIRKVSVLQ